MRLTTGECTRGAVKQRMQSYHMTAMTHAIQSSLFIVLAKQKYLQILLPSAVHLEERLTVSQSVS